MVSVTDCICVYFFTKSIEIKPMFNSIRKGVVLQLNNSVKCIDYLTTLLTLLPVAKNLMPLWESNGRYAKASYFFLSRFCSK